MSGAINLLIADDDPIVRDGLAAIFNYQDGITVSATAANGVEALAAVERNLVDVALIDVDMPVLDGIAVAKILGRDYPYIAVVMLTAFEHEESLAQSLAANVRGFLTKDISGEQLALLIKQVYTGINVMSPRPAQLVADIYLKAQINHENYQDFIDAVEQLPSHLRIVFDRIIKAKTNKTIAGELGLSETTIRSYVSDIFSATGFSSRAELTVTAIKAGY